MPEQQTFSDGSSFSRLKEVYSVARAENANASIAERAALGGALVGLAFEWTSGNESMLGFVGSTAHELTHNPALVGAASGAASFVEQSAIGALVALSINNYPNAMKRMRESINYDRDSSEDSRAKRFARVMLLGSGVEVMVENSRHPHTGPENTRRAIANAATIGAANTALIGAVSGVMLLGERYGLERVTDPLVDILSNPLTYMVAIIGSVGLNKIRKVSKKMTKQTHNLIDDRAVSPTGEKTL